MKDPAPILKSAQNSKKNKIKVKRGMHVVAIDDSPHHKGQEKSFLCFVFTMGTLLDKVLSARIRVDGIDGTDAIIKTLADENLNYSVILTHGITIGGFNLIDINKLHIALGVPIISITENTPKGDLFIKAISNLDNKERRLEIVKNAGEMYEYKTKFGKKPLFFYCKGISKEESKKIILILSKRSRLPEPLLMAHKIASAFIF